eukprot:TRINITY_DN636_c3_g1_i1.p1 TRINITY_DN636_c3_g1~~TRINITY_DN636_c3_g1_i1.p1  ORF type:complete len:490 (-),score=93.46 TRINITY_DN636_c3_g1_i1:151-1620(-)
MEKNTITFSSLMSMLDWAIAGFSVKPITVRSTHDRGTDYLIKHGYDKEKAIDASITKNYSNKAKWIRSIGCSIPFLGVPMGTVGPMWRLMRDVALIAWFCDQDLYCEETRYQIVTIVLGESMQNQSQTPSAMVIPLTQGPAAVVAHNALEGVITMQMAERLVEERLATISKTVGENGIEYTLHYAGSVFGKLGSTVGSKLGRFVSDQGSGKLLSKVVNEIGNKAIQIEQVRNKALGLAVNQVQQSAKLASILGSFGFSICLSVPLNYFTESYFGNSDKIISVAKDYFTGVPPVRKTHATIEVEQTNTSGGGGDDENGIEVSIKESPYPYSKWAWVGLYRLNNSNNDDQSDSTEVRNDKYTTYNWLKKKTNTNTTTTTTTTTDRVDTNDTTSAVESLPHPEDSPDLTCKSSTTTESEDCEVVDDDVDIKGDAEQPPTFEENFVVKKPTPDNEVETVTFKNISRGYYIVRYFPSWLGKYVHDCESNIIFVR